MKNTSMAFTVTLRFASRSADFAVQHVYDIQIPLVDAVDITYSINESFDILKHALAPLGEDYVQLLDQAREVALDRLSAMCR